MPFCWAASAMNGLNVDPGANESCVARSSVGAPECVAEDVAAIRFFVRP